ncbi:MAG: head GIN domain-containing protein [Desulfobacterales bacterium]
MKIKTLQLSAMFTFIAFMTAGCIFIVNGKSTQGSGNIVTGEREVSEFNKIHLKGSGNVLMTLGEKQTLKIKTDDNIMPLIETVVRGDKMTISHGKHHLRPTVFEVFITVKDLAGVAISGSGDIRGKGKFVTDTFYAEISGSGDMDLEIETDRLEAKISGSGSIRLAGKAEDYTVSISGSGEVNAFEVQAKNVSVKISGSGDCRVHAAESLVAKISGSGDVYYKGRPQINTKISGSGSLISRD